MANEGGGRLVLGMKDDLPHDVVGTNFAKGKIGALEDEVYSRIAIEYIVKNYLTRTEKGIDYGSSKPSDWKTAEI